VWAVSPYPIIASAASGGSFNPGNYTISYVDGTLRRGAGCPRHRGQQHQQDLWRHGKFQRHRVHQQRIEERRNGRQRALVQRRRSGDRWRAGSPYAIVASAASGGSFNPGNYTISYVDGTLGVIPVGLLGIAANAATKTYDGSPYSGGNGVTYTGFQGTDTAASLGGTLAYGGSSQGAVMRATTPSSRSARVRPITPLSISMAN